MLYRILILLLLLSAGLAACDRETKVAPRIESPILVKIGDKYGYVDRTGRKVFPQLFDHAAIFSEGLAAVRMGDKDGYIDLTGNLAIPAKYDSASIFLDGLAAVKVGDRWGYIDRTGKTVIATRFVATFAFTEGLAFGFISYSILKAVSGQGLRVHWLFHLVSAAFVARYVLLRG